MSLPKDDRVYLWDMLLLELLVPAPPAEDQESAR